jgi:predicted  nucleic acid-binding Zn-ribbon protein
MTMAKKSRLTQVAVKIGTAMGKADRGVQKVARAGSLAKKELDDISKQVDALKRQLRKTAKRLKRALS